MIPEKKFTLFILGAGASVPYGYPTGHDLRKYIISNLYKELTVYSQIDQFHYNYARPWLDKAEDFISSFKKSGTISIDLFLSRRPEFVDIGKLAITLSLLNFERNSGFVEETNRGFDQDWYNHLFTEMTKTLTIPDSYNYFSRNAVAFITFNYDRSLESFLYNALVNNFLKTDNMDRLAKELKYIPIHHVYGTLGDLPWQNENGKEYGFHFRFSDVLTMKDNIKTIPERTSIEPEKIKELFSFAERTFFLGFGFAEENVSILNLRNNIKPGLEIFATALKSTDLERRKKSISFPGHAVPLFEDMDCLRILREHMA